MYGFTCCVYSFQYVLALSWWTSKVHGLSNFYSLTSYSYSKVLIHNSLRLVISMLIHMQYMPVASFPLLAIPYWRKLSCSDQLNNNPHHSDWHHLLFLANHTLQVIVSLQLSFHCTSMLCKPCSCTIHTIFWTMYELDGGTPGPENETMVH